MQFHATPLTGVFVVEPRVFGDARGFFFESFNEKRFWQGLAETGGGAVHRLSFVQDNHSGSAQHVLRGLHFQVGTPQGKLVRVIQGEVFDVVVDIRPDSPSCGQWFGVRLSAENRQQLWIPPGLAHGFLVLSPFAEFLYKTTDYWVPAAERTLAWDDACLSIDWPLPNGQRPTLSAKDQQGLSLREAMEENAQDTSTQPTISSAVS